MELEDAKQLLEDAPGEMQSRCSPRPWAVPACGGSVSVGLLAYSSTYGSDLSNGVESCGWSPTTCNKLQQDI
ncbi:hypothetical protein [Paenibacillus sp. PL2-23]|uniref:hypothetical protein n=1 Tax=Paenibacillus sp. PL2-23 TaxID=2100729 RepID=UPI0030FB9C83